MNVEKILRQPELQALVGLGRTQIYLLIRAGKFPKPIHLSGRAVGWLASEVAEWQQSRIAERDGGAA